MAKIFICYRRADSGGHAGRLYDHLVARFGKHRVYMDIDSIPPGADFVEEVQRALNGCAAVIVLIGQYWFSGENRNRLNTPGDHVRQEIVQALKSKAKVYPVLVHGARMPTALELPRDVQPLARKHAIDIRDVSFAADFQQLAKSLERLEGLKPAGRKTKTPASGSKGGKSATAKTSGGSGDGKGGRGRANPGQVRSGTGATTPSPPRGVDPSGSGSASVRGSRVPTAKADTRTKSAAKTADTKPATPPKRARSAAPAPATAKSMQPKSGQPKAKANGARGGSAGGGRRAKGSGARQTGAPGAKGKKPGSPGKGRGGR